MAITAVSDIDTAVLDFYQKNTPVTIETKDLILRPVQESDLGFFQTVYTDPVTMKLFMDHEKRLENSPATWQEEQMKSAAGRVKTFVERWTTKNPFSGFIICKKVEKDHVPIGFIVPGLGDNKGQVEMAFVILNAEQRKGFGTQAVHAIVHKYLPSLIANHDKLYGSPLLVEDNPIKEVVATARVDNPASICVMEKAGMKKIGENFNKWGQLRGIYGYTYENLPIKI